MSCFRRIIIRDGTSQTQRLLPSSDPAMIEIDDRKVEKLLAFIADFAKQLSYRNFSNNKEGDWTSFVATTLEDIKKMATLLELAEVGKNPVTNRNLPAHQVVLLIFIQLFTYLQKDFNSVAKKHLAYYYSKILLFKLLNAKPDQVHVLFELNKQTKSFKIDGGSLLFAGKDEEGRDQLYKIKREVTINQAVIGEIRTLFVQSSQLPRLFKSVLNYEQLVSMSADRKRWEPFGLPDAASGVRGQSFETASLGWAIASPLLWLSEGVRNISVTIKCDIPATFVSPLNSETIAQHLQVDLSTMNSWFPAPLKFGTLTYNLTDVQIDLHIDIPVDFPAVTPPIFDVSLSQHILWPALRCRLRPEAPDSLYQQFQSFKIKLINLAVGVIGYKKLIIYNDLGPIETGKPFQPFGTLPRPDTSFYIGSPEFFNKKLSTLEIALHWNNIPNPNLGNYYRGYFKKSDGKYLSNVAPVPPDPIANPDFKVNLEQLIAGQWVPLSVSDLSLFDADASQPVFFRKNTAYNELDLQHFGTQPEMVVSELPAPSKAQNGYIAIRLQPTTSPAGFKTGIRSFGHDEFPTVLSEIAIGKALNNVDFTNVDFPNQPYTPAIKEVLINYTSEETLDFTSASRTAQFLHIEPFGIRDLKIRSSLIPVIPKEGYLYIGLDKLTPPQNVSFLFQIEEGTNDPDKTLLAQDIEWSYLSGDQWIILENNAVIADTTRGFQTSGIIELSIGADSTQEHTLMPSGRHWIRGFVAANAAGACEVVAVYTQAATAEYITPELPEDIINLEDLEVEPLDLAKHILPENSIKQLAVLHPEVRAILQPYPSFDGSSVEALRSFYARISERLRHRNRPVTMWDYERIVLQAFPDIYKVKCLPHTNPSVQPAASQAPGNVTLVVVPSFFGRVQRVLEPRANSITLIRIREFLEQSAPVQTAVHVVNPVYERIMLDFKVGFYEGKDPGYYSKVLNDELVQFLSPWAFDSSRDIIFGGSFTRSDVIDFIEKRDYVDFVTDLFMYSSASGPGCPGIGEMSIITSPGTPVAPLDFTVREVTAPGVGVMAIEDNFIVGEPLEILSASGDLSIIVSAEQHLVRPVQKNVCTILPGTGIGAWFIEIDFEVQNN